MKLDKVEVINTYTKLLEHFWKEVLNLKGDMYAAKGWYDTHVEAQMYEEDEFRLVFFNDSRYNEAACYRVSNNGLCGLLWSNAYNQTTAAEVTFKL